MSIRISNNDVFWCLYVVVSSICRHVFMMVQFVVVLGQSGGGKSTMLSLIGTIDRPTKGQVELLGNSMCTVVMVVMS